jgi:chaperonin GroEL
MSFLTNKNKKIVRKETIISNVMNSETTNQMIKDTLEFISKTVSSSLGPYGANTIISDQQLSHFITKDGFTILKNIMLLDNGPRTILDIIQKISQNLVTTVGDGSTSSVVIADELFNNLYKLKKEHRLTNTQIEKLLNAFKEFIKIKTEFSPYKKKEFTDQDITDIATISANNNQEIGLFLTELFQKIGREGIFHIERSTNEKTSYNITSGYEIPRGYIDPVFITDDKQNIAELENARVLLCNGIMSNAEITPVVAMLRELIIDPATKQESVTPLIIIAKDFTKDFKELFTYNKKNNITFPVLLVDIATGTTSAKEKVFDLSLYIGGKLYDKENGELVSLLNSSYLGKVDRVICTSKNCKLIGTHADKDILETRVSELKEKILNYQRTDNQYDFSMEIWELKRRIASLTNSLAKVFVGGTTELEKETTKYLMEDAVLAVQSACNYGTTIGGNLLIPWIIHECKGNLIDSLSNNESLDFCMVTTINDFIDAIDKSFKHAFLLVLKNMGDGRSDAKNLELIERMIMEKKMLNLVTLKYDTFDSTNVRNSIKTDLEIMESAFSIVGLLTNSNQFVSRGLIQPK